MSRPIHEPHENESKPWWIYALIALGVLLLIGLLLWALADDDDDADDAAAPVTTTLVAPVPTTADDATNGSTTSSTTAAAGQQAAGPLTSLAALLSADDADLVGRPVSLTDVPVPAVIGDRAFVVGSADQQVLAVLAEAIPERGVNVNPNETVTFTGVIRDMPANPATAFRGVEPSELEGLTTRDFYLQVTEITFP